MKDSKSKVIMYCIMSLFVIWIALLIAPNIKGGLPEIVQEFPKKMEQPFNISICKDSVKSILIFLGIYIVGVGIYESTKKNYKRGKEYGSAVWGSSKEINKKYMQLPIENNKILTQNVRIGLKAKEHRRNLNVLVCGGSGSGKTRFYGKPNIMQCNCSYVILDPKGEILRDTGYLLEKEGYKIKVLDLVNPELSHCYNPLMYVKDDNDVQKLVSNIFQSTTPKGSSTSDPFWDIAASMLLTALILYLKYEAPIEEQNFDMVNEMLRAGTVKEDDEDYKSPLDLLFLRLEKRNPNHIAVKYYKDYHSGAGRTLKSIQVTLSSKLEKFNIKDIAKLTMTDELELGKLGEEKVALFAVIPDTHTSFNFLVSILYTQLFQELLYKADNEYGGALPVHVHFLMDEFANVSLPNDFDKILSVMRSRNISVSIILQNLSQLKKLFEKEWESIVGNCDEFLYLGGNEQSTQKYVSELLGKETIDTNTYGKSTGHSGSYSTNYQNTGRELMTADEVRMLSNDKAILFIRGEKPIIDYKYNILKHPNLKYTADGEQSVYQHGKIEKANTTINILECNSKGTKEEQIIKTSDLKIFENYGIFSEEEIEEFFDEEELKNEENKRNGENEYEYDE